MKWENFPFKTEKQYRLKGWDYSRDGFYFVTICTKDRENYFGKIENKIMNLSKTGIIVEEIWKQIPKHFNNVELDRFTIMPNHFHGIVVIKNDCLNKNDVVCRNMPWHVPTKEIGNIYIKKINEFSKPISKSLAMIVNHFKGTVKRECNKNGIIFNWQSRFHDRIIRNDKELWAKRIYIKNNSSNWAKDKENRNKDKDNLDIV